MSDIGIPHTDFEWRRVRCGRAALGFAARSAARVGVDSVPPGSSQVSAEELGGRVVQPAQEVPGVTFGVFADAQGHVVGVAAS
jgi:hypothetical protein